MQISKRVKRNLTMGDNSKEEQEARGSRFLDLILICFGKSFDKSNVIQFTIRNKSEASLFFKTIQELLNV
jgi:hypothetical protein